MIGIFDSGVGGLTIFREVKDKLPDYDYIYVGDTARTPYGNHSQETIFRFTREAAAYLFAQGCELVILACNTASAEALRRLQQEWLPQHHPRKRILGVIQPLAEYTADAVAKQANEKKGRKTNRVAVIGTRATIESNVYATELGKLQSDMEVLQKATSLLVPLVEENWIRRPETKRIIRDYLSPLKQKQPGILILGCTHYPALIKEIRHVMGKNCKVPHPGKIVAASLADYLQRHPDIDGKLGKNGKQKILVTEKTPVTQSIADRLMGKHVELESVELQ